MKPIDLTHKRLLIFPFLLLLISVGCTKKSTRIICIGDSITEGYGLTEQCKTSYPAQLDLLLQNATVQNEGRSAATLQKRGDFPYWITKEFSNVFASQPDVIIIQLGTNDTKPYNWNHERFRKDYQSLIDTLKTIPTNPKLYLCIPVPAFQTKWGINDSTIIHGVTPVVKELANKNQLPVIDLYNAMKYHVLNFPDSIHPNEKATHVMAKVIALEIEATIQ